MDASARSALGWVTFAVRRALSFEKIYIVDRARETPLLTRGLALFRLTLPRGFDILKVEGTARTSPSTSGT